MNVSEVYIPLMNIALYIQRVEIPDKKNGLSFGRRVRSVSEIAEYNNYLEVARWDPSTDTFATMFKDSYIINQISETSGKSSAELMEELERREKFIHDMIELGIDNQKDVAEKVLDHMRNRLADFQEETGDLFNLEATPAEGSLAPDEKVLVSQSDPSLNEIGPLVDKYLEKIVLATGMTIDLFVYAQEKVEKMN